MPATAWGIDIGNRGLKAVKLARAAEGIKVADYAFVEHETILSEAGDNRDTVVETSLAKFVGRHDTRRTPVAVSVSGQQSFARFVKLPPVEPKKIPEIVKFEAVQQVPFPLDEVEWSYQLFQTDDDPDIEVGIFAIRKELVNASVGRMLAVDLDVTAVQTSPLAVYNAMRHDGRLDKGHSVIVDLGADSTDLIVADADTIWLRSLDIGGNNFTEALAKAFKIDFEKAEEMKRNAKTSKYAKQIYQAMRPVFGELVGEIQRSLGFFGSTRRDAKLRKVIALGGGFRLNGLSGYVQKNLQMPVEKPTKFAAVAPEEAGAASALSENLLSSTAAYGLALQALGEARVTSSLLPTQIRKDKMWKDKTKYFVAAAGLAVAGAAVGFAGYLFNDMAYERADRQRAEIKQLIGQAQGLDARWTELTGSGAQELQTVKNVNLLVQDRALWGQILADIYAALPAPEGELATALAGGLGDPQKIDEADIEAVKKVPREDRDYVRVERLESVYSDALYEVANAPNFFSVAEEILTQFKPDDFRGVITREAPEAIANPVIENEKARGFIVRLTLTTPMPYEQAVRRFTQGTDRPANRLIQIGPSEREPNKPYAVATATERHPRPVGESQDRLKAMEEAYAARQALEGDAAAAEQIGASSAAPGRAPNAGRPPAGDPYGGYGGEFGGYGGGYGGYGNPGGGGRPTPGQTGQATAEGGETNPAYADPITGESRLQDTEFTVVFVVQLDPRPFGSEAAPTDGGDAAVPAEGIASAQ